VVPVKYGYLVGDLILLTVWVFLFWRRKDVRKEMLVLSAVCAILGPISEYWYFADYWKPPMVVDLDWPFGGLEDLLFGFSIGGISAAVYEVLLRKRLVCPREKPRQNWILLVFPVLVVTTMVTLNTICGLNSIYASSIAFVIAFGLMVKARPDLFWDAALSGLLVTSIMFVLYFFYLPYFLREIGREAWFLYDTSHGTLILGRVPLTEMIWGVTWGMVGGPLYEFWRGCTLKPA